MNGFLKRTVGVIALCVITVMLAVGCAGLPGGNSRIIDRVYIGNPASESSHKMQIDASETGVNIENWRHAIDGGYFQYTLKTGGNENLSLQVRYWSYEIGERSFNIYTEDTVIATENVVGKFNNVEVQRDFHDVEYPIPAELVRGKETITVKFQGVDEYNMAGGIYGISLLNTGVVQ
jgi:hypothetical protein